MARYDRNPLEPHSVELKAVAPVLLPAGPIVEAATVELVLSCARLASRVSSAEPSIDLGSSAPDAALRCHRLTSLIFAGAANEPWPPPTAVGASGRRARRRRSDIKAEHCHRPLRRCFFTNFRSSCSRSPFEGCWPASAPHW